MRLYEVPIAHRGLHDNDSPENSMSAFKKALDAGYNIEIDVHLLTDGKLAIFHDSDLGRMLPKYKGIKIETLSSKDLAGKDYLLPNGEHIPLFEELIELVDGKVEILCELKSGSFFKYDLEKAVHALIKNRPWIRVQSFNPFSMVWFRFNAKEVVRGQLSADFPIRALNWLAHVFGTFPLLNLVKPDFLAYNIGDLPSAAVTRACKRHNMKLLSWTVKTDALVSQAHEAGVDNIIFENIRPESYKK